MARGKEREGGGADARVRFNAEVARQLSPLRKETPFSVSLSWRKGVPLSLLSLLAIKGKKEKKEGEKEGKEKTLFHVTRTYGWGGGRGLRRLSKKKSRPRCSSGGPLSKLEERKRGKKKKEKGKRMGQSDWKKTLAGLDAVDRRRA